MVDFLSPKIGEGGVATSLIPPDFDFSLLLVGARGGKIMI